MRIVDDLERIRLIDRYGMLQAIRSAPEQLIEALQASERVELKGIEPSKISNAVIAGVGGSAIAGEVIRDWARDRLSIPLEVLRDTHLPAYVKRDSLVIVVSYSGETYEALSVFKDARKRGCFLVAVSSGGTLARWSTRCGIPLFRVRPGLQPRAALPQLLVAAASAIHGLGLSPNLRGQITSAAAEVRKARGGFDTDVPFEKNDAKKVAQGLVDRLPIIYCLEKNASTAVRFKTQLNENGKINATAATIPEACHNDVEAWGHLPLWQRGKAAAIFLRDAKETDFERAAQEEMMRMIRRVKGGRVFEFLPEARTRLGTLLSTILFGDYVSFYAAILRRLDPSPVTSIASLKASIKRRVRG